MKTAAAAARHRQVPVQMLQAERCRLHCILVRGFGGQGVYRPSLNRQIPSCYAYGVNWEGFVYPAYGTPLAEAFGGRYESVFVALHPFVRMAPERSWSRTRHYPEDGEIRAAGRKCSWSEVAAESDLKSCARMNRTLLTAIGSLTGDEADSQGCYRLRSFLQANPVWMPTEGRFEPLLQADILRIFAESGFEDVLFVPETPQTEAVLRLPLERLRGATVPFPNCGTLLAPDGSFLFTVDWDSFFTLFYGQRSLIDEAVQGMKLEGFFASPNTEHAWWNYSLGCATVTVSPEDWQKV